jgi:peptidoglycan hydrolase-like protein with peptidoglycan-binding domain
MKKYSIALGIVFSLVVAVPLVYAETGDVDTASVSTCTDLQNNLRYRTRDASVNGEVSLLQDFLQAKGYLHTEPTGFFGLMTFQAAKDFQRNVGLSPTGYVGPLTRAKIKVASCVTTIHETTTVPTITGVSGTFYHNIRNYAYGKNLRDVIRAYITPVNNTQGYYIENYPGRTDTIGLDIPDTPPLPTGEYNLYLVNNVGTSSPFRVNLSSALATPTTTSQLTIESFRSEDVPGTPGAKQIIWSASTSTPAVIFAQCTATMRLYIPTENRFITCPQTGYVNIVSYANAVKDGRITVIPYDHTKTEYGEFTLSLRKAADYEHSIDRLTIAVTFRPTATPQTIEQPLLTSFTSATNGQRVTLSWTTSKPYDYANISIDSCPANRAAFLTAPDGMV